MKKKKYKFSLQPKPQRELKKKKQLLLSDWVYFLSFCNVCGAVDHSDVISCEFLYMYSNSVN